MKTSTVTEIRSIIPEEIKPDFTLSAQYIAMGFAYLCVPYQGVNRGNILIMKQNKFLTAAQISLHEHYKISVCDYVMKAYVAQLFFLSFRIAS